MVIFYVTPTKTARLSQILGQPLVEIPETTGHLYVELDMVVIQRQMSVSLTATEYTIVKDILRTIGQDPQLDPHMMYLHDVLHDTDDETVWDHEYPFELPDPTVEYPPCTFCVMDDSLYCKHINGSSE